MLASMHFPRLLIGGQRAPSLPSRTKASVAAVGHSSAVAAMEGIVEITTGKLFSLSEQELVDCDINGGSQGCNGGEMDDAFEFIIKNGGLANESSYLYTAKDGKCKKYKNVATIKGYEDVPANDEAALMKAVANQPVSVVVDGGDMTFQFYSGGVMTGSCGTNL